MFYGSWNERLFKLGKYSKDPFLMELETVGEHFLPEMPATLLWWAWINIQMPWGWLQEPEVIKNNAGL